MPAPVDAARATAAVRRHRLRTRWLAAHAGVFAIVNGYFLVTWALVRLDPTADVDAATAGPWPLYQAATWAVVLGVHALYVWLRRPDDAVRAAAGIEGRVVRTVLFTDIVGSTETASRLGDARWSELLERHDRTAARLAARSDGTIVKQTGDGIVATFESAPAAIRFAARVRDELRTSGIEIRAGAHAGEIDLRDGDIAGISVHVAARVMAAAAPSEILVSRTVRDLAAGSHIAFSERGIRHLKGLDGRWELYAAAVDGERNDA